MTICTESATQLQTPNSIKYSAICAVCLGRPLRWTLTLRNRHRLARAEAQLSGGTTGGVGRDRGAVAPSLLEWRAQLWISRLIKRCPGLGRLRAALRGAGVGRVASVVRADAGSAGAAAGAAA